MIDLPTADTPGVLAELGQSCGSDVGAYVEAVDAFADAGAWGCKIQMIEPGLLAARDARPYWSTSRYAPTQVESFVLAGAVPHDGWGPVRERCADRGVAFVATPFDLGALDALADLDPDAVKIASGDITYRQLVVGAAERFGQIVLSTGASYDHEVQAAMRWCRVAGKARVLPLACSLEYPTPWESAHLARIGSLAELVRAPVGYSDHTVQTDPAAAESVGAAVGAAGAALAEKHVAVYEAVGQVPDLDMAMDPDLIRYYVEGLALGAELRGSALLDPHPGEEAAREGARRSLVITGDLPAGHVLTDEDVVALRPCPPWALGPEHAEMMVGGHLAEPVRAGRVRGWSWAGADAEVIVDTVPLGESPPGWSADQEGML